MKKAVSSGGTDRSEISVMVINGPNLNMLGARQPEVYGTQTLDDLMSELQAAAGRRGVKLEFFQSNIEGELVSAVQRAAGRHSGIIINPAAYTHTSVALRDALLATGLPCVEVHLSNVFAREEFRHTSLTAPACIGQVAGFGGYGYCMALDGLLKKLEGN